MRTNKTSKVILLILSLMMLLSITVFAEPIPILITNDNTTALENAFDRAELEIEGSNSNKNRVIEVVSKRDDGVNSGKEKLLTYKSGSLEFSPEAFKNANNKKAKAAMTVFINELKDSAVDLDMQQEIMSTIQESDNDVAAVMIPLIFDESKADLYTAYKWLYPFLSIVRILFGIGAIGIIFLLVGSTIIDLVYIGLPVWREQQAENGKSKNPFGVSYEAIKTVKEIELSTTEGNYQNAYLLYFKRRALTYIVLAICLLYLIVGELGGLISWILSLASGVVG